MAALVCLLVCCYIVYGVRTMETAIVERRFRKITLNDVGLMITVDIFSARSVLTCSVQCLKTHCTAFIYDYSNMECTSGMGTDPLGTKPLSGQSLYVAEWSDGSTTTQTVNLPTLDVNTVTPTEITTFLDDATTPVESPTTPAGDAVQPACNTSLGYKVTTENTTNACIYVSSTATTYYTATTNCANLSGRLATMKSLEKRNVILKAVLEQAANKTRFWLGLQSTTGTLSWSDGQSMTNVEKLLPFYVMSSCGLPTCGCYAYNKTTDKLMDTVCLTTLPYICEYVM